MEEEEKLQTVQDERLVLCVVRPDQRVDARPVLQ